MNRYAQKLADTLEAEALRRAKKPLRWQRYALDQAFERLGEIQERLTALSDVAADLADDELSASVMRLAQWQAVVVDRTRRLRNGVVEVGH